jgi:hypothetical protein
VKSDKSANPGRRKGPEPLPVIGWREWVSLPELGIGRIKVKVDTGARSSSLHAYDLEYVEVRGKRLVRFKVHPLQRDSHTVIEAEAELLEVRGVRNSGGKLEHRPVIVTAVELMGELWPIELSLTRRDVMGFRMLLGRQAVRGRFTIDPSRSYYDGRLTKKRRTRYKGDGR